MIRAAGEPVQLPTSKVQRLHSALASENVEVVIRNMAKPLVASSFFTFPKFLLWSLPLVFLLIGAWLKGGLDGSNLSAILTHVTTVEQQVVGKVSLTSCTPTKLCGNERVVVER